MFSFSEIGNPGEQKPYYPFPVALSRGLLPSLDEVSPPFPDQLGEVIAADRIPNAKQAGLVRIDEEQLIAFDHCAAELDPRVIKIIPTEKSAVSKDGEIEKEGLTVVSKYGGTVLRVIRAHIDPFKHPWHIDRYKDRISVGQLMKPIVEVRFGVELPEYELTNIDSQTGEATYKARSIYY